MSRLSSVTGFVAVEIDGLPLVLPMKHVVVKSRQEYQDLMEKNPQTKITVKRGSRKVPATLLHACGKFVIYIDDVMLTNPSFFRTQRHTKRHQRQSSMLWRLMV